ncbi:MAG TPA: phage portal protein [Phycisphaerae bacterium]|nr:phage portal protein [Phycisphaerae bacterium]
MSRKRNAIENPTLAQAFVGLRDDYNAARTSRFRRKRLGINPSGSSADYHYRSESDYLRMMELSREFFRNDVVVGQGVRRLIDNCIQDGFSLDPQTGDEALDLELWERWDAFAREPDACDLAGRLDFHAMERLVLQATIVDGDILALATQDGPLELIEAHRLRGPANAQTPPDTALVHGVLLNQHRRPLQYWITRDDLSPLAALKANADMAKYDARDKAGERQVFHIFRPDRVSQTRGVTAFAPIVDAIGMHDDIQFAKLVQQQIVSCFGFIRARQMDFGGNAPAAHGDTSTETLRDGSSRTVEGIAPGMEMTSEPGETITAFSPNVPNAEFFDHASLILTFISINLNLPLAVLLLDPSKTNFSGWRGAIDQARMGFREIQRWLAGAFHRPVYRFKVRQWLAEDAALAKLAAQLGPKMFAHRWNPPTWAYIEPLKDGQADLLQVRNALTSPRRLHARRGADWDEVFTEIIADNSAAITAAKTAAAGINKQFPDDDAPVHWREILSLPTPDGVQIVPAPPPPAQTKPEEDDDAGA